MVGGGGRAKGPRPDPLGFRPHLGVGVGGWVGGGETHPPSLGWAQVLAWVSAALVPVLVMLSRVFFLGSMPHLTQICDSCAVGS